MHKLDVNRSIKKVPKGDVAFDSSLPLVLNHLDLSPNNMVVDDNSRI
jgi:thiamine kinase-like enzyme